MKRIFAANWKLFKSPEQTRTYFMNFVSEAQGLSDEIVFFPPATSWEATSQSLQGSSIHWGGQNVYCETQGAFTGENSAQVLKELGAQYVLIGHSERRKIFRESEELLAKKVKLASELGLIPMLCIGETLEEREQNKTEKVNTEQLTQGLSLVKPGIPLVVAYEPVWAIGTGKVASPQQAEETHQQVKATLERLGFKEVPVLYGGSVKPDNAKELLAQPHIDGFLVGGASLEVKSFLDICRS